MELFSIFRSGDVTSAHIKIVCHHTGTVEFGADNSQVAPLAGVSYWKLRFEAVIN
uniref:Uncharacterized protein n=1 Tax=Arundo donax TaxID=35708 RepID=A0A0A9DEK5_ARUDO